MKTTSTWDFYINNLQYPNVEKELVLNNKYIHEFFFIESIENTFLTAELAIDDKYGFFEIMTITGKENIKVIIKQSLDGKGSIEKIIEFEIFNITIETPTPQENIHRFYLIEKGASKFYGSNYCVGFQNEKISGIVKSVLENQLGVKSSDYEIESTNDKLENYIIPYVKPSQTIKALIKKARREKAPHDGGYLFFSTTGDENRTKPMKKFVSFSSLIKGGAKPQNDYEIYSFRKRDANQYFINTFKEVYNPNYSKQSIKVNGIGGKHYFGINYNNDKNPIEVTQKYSDFIDKSNIMGRTAFFDKGIDNVNDEVDFYGGEEETLTARQDSSFRNLIEGYNRREVIMEGALFRYVGKMIWVEQMSINQTEVHNTQDYGWWMIKNISHYYALGIYTQKIILIKDSYQESPATKDKLLA